MPVQKSFRRLCKKGALSCVLLADLDIEKAGVDLLYKCCEGLINDPTTYEIMVAYLKDEEEDLYWSQGALELIEKIGQQNWLFTQV